MSTEVDPQGFERRISQHAEWMRVHHLSERTVETFGRCLRAFAAWAAERAITRPSEVTRQVLERYQARLFHARKPNGEPLTLSTQSGYLVALKNFFRWLTRQNLILFNPASEIDMPSKGVQLPQALLSVPEVNRILAAPDLSTPRGVRDRAILETLYSTGIRRSELAALKLYDVEPDQGMLIVRRGKGRRQRVVPVGARALSWISRYLEEVRPAFIVPPDEGHVFLSHRGRPLVIGFLTHLIRRYFDQAGIQKSGSMHLLRHAMATHMLENGADVRYVQAILGHARLDTTAVYTHVAIRKLKQVHAATHPAEAPRKTRPKSSRPENPPSRESSEGQIVDPGATGEAISRATAGGGADATL